MEEAPPVRRVSTCPQNMTAAGSDKKSGGRRLTLATLGLRRASSAGAGATSGSGLLPGGGGGGRARGRRQAFVGVHFRKEKLVKQLTSALEREQSDKVDELLEGVEYADIDPDGTYLRRAVLRGSLALVRVLLKNGAPVNVFGDDNCCPLHIAAKSGSASTLSLLLAHDALVDVPMRFEKRTPLHGACLAGCAEAVTMLLDRGASVNSADIYGSTPLQLASQTNRLDVVRLLLDRGADVDRFDHEGWTALHLAASAGHHAVVLLLLERHANVDAQSKYGRTPLHWACIHQRLEVVKTLVGADANTNIRDFHGHKAALYAAAAGRSSALAQFMARHTARDDAAAATSSIGSLVEISPRVSETLTPSNMERASGQPAKQQDGPSEAPATSLGTLTRMVSIQEVDESGDSDVDRGFVSQETSTSVSTPKSERSHKVLSVDSMFTQKSVDYEDETDAAAANNNNSNSNARHPHEQQVRAAQAHLRRIHRKLSEEVAGLSAAVTAVSRQVSRALAATPATPAPGSGAGSSQLRDAFAGLQRVGGRVDDVQQTLTGDVQTCESSLSLLDAALAESERQHGASRVSLVTTFCQAAVTALSRRRQQHGTRRWLQLLRAAIPLGESRRISVQHQIEGLHLPDDSLHLQEVLLYWLAERGGNCDGFLTEVLQHLDEKERHLVVEELVTRLLIHSRETPSKAVLSSITAQLPPDTISALRERLQTAASNQNQAHQPKHNKSGHSPNSDDLIVDFVYGNSEPSTDLSSKIISLVEGLILLKHEHLLVMLCKKS